MNYIATAIVAICGSCFSTGAAAHSEHEKARFVAATGADAGDCASPVRPCKSIAYAMTRANKGDRVLVAGGTYPVEHAEELFHLTSGLVSIETGFSRYDQFRKAEPERRIVTLTGVPPAFREALIERGFHVIADRKGLSRTAIEQSQKMLAQVEQMRISKSRADCVGGQADGLPCDNVDLLAHLALPDLSLNPDAANDIWGFVDLNTDREYVIIGLQNGTAVVDVSDPTAPVEVASISGEATSWRDIKVLQTYDGNASRWRVYAYITADSASEQLRILDLSGLPNSAPVLAVTGDFQAAHNVYLSGVDYATGLAAGNAEPMLQIAGANLAVGNFRSYSLATPDAPALVAVSSGGYMHDGTSLEITDSRKDTQCQSAGPVCQLLVDFNESTFEIWDVTTSATPALVSSTPYQNASYVHSGWWSEDRQFLFVHDELDEQQRGLNTTLRVFSIADLTAPVSTTTWTGPTEAIDHNGFVRGNRYYMSNYTRGLTVLDISAPASLAAVGHLDTFAPSDATGFSGAWGVYPFFPSGTLAISDIDSGLYLARDRSLDVAQGSLSFASRASGGPEGESLTVEVTRTGGTSGAISVGYEFINASADAQDYQGSAGTLNWADGDGAPKTLQIPLSDDGLAESPERFLVRLANPQGGATLSSPSYTSAFISDAGAQSEISVKSTTISLSEDTRQAVVTIGRDASATGAVSVDFSASGAASLGNDLDGPASGTLDWPDGDATPRTLVYRIIDDADDEADETLQVTLSNPVATLIGDATTTLTIVDNDAANGGGGTTPPPPPSSGGGGGAIGSGGLAILMLLLLGPGVSRRFLLPKSG